MTYLCYYYCPVPREIGSETAIACKSKALKATNMPPPPRTAPRPKSRNWCFTLNNFTEEDFDKIDAWHTLNPTAYIIYGKEAGEETETPHLQGYVHLKAPQAMSFLKRFLPRARLAICKGSPEENIAYCSKEDDHPMVYGAEPKTQQQANKDKAKRFIDLAKKGDFKAIEEEMPGKYSQQYRTMHQIATDNMVRPADLEDTCGVWIYGESGCGKTHAARTEYGTYFSKPCNKWWDGYQNEDCVIVEDMDPEHNKLAYHLKLWTDKWSFTGEVKGGTRSLRPKKVIITSQYSIEEVFHNSPQDQDALNRRCKVIHMHNRLLRSE